jgi:hypothetical protein
MAAATKLHDGYVYVLDYRCDTGPVDKPYAELHRGYSLSYVRRGSFGVAAADGCTSLSQVRC